MRLFVYIILLVLALIVFKAFYLDSRQGESVSETNASAETVQSETPPAPVPEPVVARPEYNVSGMSAPAKVKTKPSYSGMPLEKVGDEIADKLKGKL